MSKYFNEIKELVQEFFSTEESEIISVEKHQTIFKWEGMILFAGYAPMVKDFIVQDADGNEVFRAEINKKRIIKLDKRYS